MASTKPARGMRDFLPVDVRKRNYVIGIIKEVYESYGFEPLETPAVENIETLMGKYGDEGNQLIFKILKRGEKLDLANAKTENDLSDLALRYDLTVPLARVVANNRNDLPKFFKRYQIQPVWRADRPARGRFREFYQCDVDCIGSESMVVEVEQIIAVSEILRRLGFQDFIVRINHRKLLAGFLEVFVKDETKNAAVLVAIDKLDKIGTEGVIQELLWVGLPEQDAIGLLDVLEVTKLQISAMTRDPYIHRTLLEMLDKEIGKDSDIGRAGIAELRELAELLTSSEIDADWRIDPSLARGLSYYTGAIMEINVPDLGGSLGGGGRYDNLIGNMGQIVIPEKDMVVVIEDPTPACGFSLGLERILVVMEERGMFPPEIAGSTAADVMVTIWDEESIPASLKLAADLRKQGIRVTVYPEAEKLGKQFKYADAIGVPFVCVLGDDEIKSGKVKLKNMKTGEEITIAARDLASNIK